VEEMADPREEQASKSRREAAQRRAARERAERLEAALKELNEVQRGKKTEEEKEQSRVSVQEPEARLMKHGDNGIAPSYNAQISTESTNKIIVGVHLTQSSSDAQSLIPAIEKVERNLGKRPEEAVVDGGYTNRDNIVDCAARQIDLVGSLPDPKERTAAAMKSLGIAPEFGPSEFRILDNGERLECPAGRTLERLRQNRKRGDRYQQYQAQKTECDSCQHKRQCCRGTGGAGGRSRYDWKSMRMWQPFARRWRRRSIGRSIENGARWRNFPTRGSKTKWDSESSGCEVWRKLRLSWYGRA